MTGCSVGEVHSESGGRGVAYVIQVVGGVSEK